MLKPHHWQLQICTGIVCCLVVLMLGSRSLASETGWTDVGRTDPSLFLDMRYATANNFLQQAVYPAPTCLLRTAVADKLRIAQKALLTQGYSFKLWDCYRPLSVQKQMWKLVPDPRYVADPRTGSRHNRGAAVDVTLVTDTGEGILMPTEFDDFSFQASPHSQKNWDPLARAHYQILLKAMTDSGFTVLQTEWWHFDSLGWQQYPISNTPLNAILKDP